MRAQRALLGTGIVPALLVALLAGCGPGYQDLPLPGSAVDGRTYTIEAPFEDALNLTKGAKVKVGGLPVGQVTSLRADGFHAVAVMDIKENTKLRAGTTARLRYDTPLGEVFVELTPSAKGKVLGDGSALAPDATSTAPSVEDTLAQASLLVNGGGLTQIQTINEELNNILGGREGNVRSVLNRANTFLTQANAASTELDALLRDLDAASRALSARKEVFGEAARALGPMAKVLREETPTLTTLLDQSSNVVARTNAVLDATQEDLVQILEKISPILEQILAVEPEFLSGIKALAQARSTLDEAIPGDFVPLDAIIRLDLRALLDANAPAGGGATAPGTGTTGSTGGGLLGGTGLGGLLNPAPSGSSGPGTGGSTGGLPLLGGLLGGGGGQ